MDKFWKWLAELANKQLAKREVKQSIIGLRNQIHCLSGEIASHFDVTGTNLVQRFNEISTRHTNDVAIVIRDIIEDKLQKHTFDVDRLYATAVKFCQDLERRIAGVEGMFFESDRKNKNRQNVLMQSFEELARQAALHDQNNTDRTLSVLNKLDLMQGVQLSTFDNVSQQIQTIHVPRTKQRFDSAPTLEWLFDNIDNFMDLGNTLYLARRNDIPRSKAKMEIIRQIRNLNLYSVLDVRDEAERLLDSWDNDQLLCAA